MREVQVPLLRAEGITKSFPGVTALGGVDFEVHPGEIHALVGENGAGKSTLVKVLSGLHQPDAGTISVDGVSVGFQHRGDAERYGITTIHQELTLVPELDVASNMLLARPPTRTGWRRLLRMVDREALYREAAAALALVNAEQIDPRARAGSLGLSAAQLILIARGLSQDMRVFILDEPTAALTPSERDELFARLRTLRGHGVGIVYVSHRLDEVLEISDRVTVMRDGKVVETMPTADARLERVIELMLARRLEEMYPQRRARQLGPKVLEVRGLRRGEELRGIDLDVHAGEIVGVTGLVGAGKTEFARAVYGADPVEAGTVRVAGQERTPRSPADGIEHGVALVPEDRKTQGLVLMLSVADNLALGVANCGRVAGTLLRLRQVISRRRAGELATDYISRFKIRARGPEQLVLGLSGGNQQKVVLSKCLATKPVLMILDEPTRGVDVGSKAELYRVIAGLADDGVGVLMLSSEVQEVVETCDRIYVLRQGRVAAEVAGPQATEGSLMRHATAEAPS
jgi:ABC-type sugar transport system ATPase subunit